MRLLGGHCRVGDEVVLLSPLSWMVLAEISVHPKLHLLWYCGSSVVDRALAQHTLGSGFDSSGLQKGNTGAVSVDSSLKSEVKAYKKDPHLHVCVCYGVPCMGFLDVPAWDISDITWFYHVPANWLSILSNRCRERRQPCSWRL